MSGGYLLAAGLASLVTYVELDETFGMPPKVKGRTLIASAMLAFVVVNAALAAGLFRILRVIGDQSIEDTETRIVLADFCLFDSRSGRA